MSGWKDTPQTRREIVVWHLLAASENLLRSQAELVTQGQKWRDEEAK